MTDQPSGSSNQEVSAFILRLRAANAGDAVAQAAVYEDAHAELSRIASSLLRREGGPVSVSVGDVVNEAVARLLAGRSVDANDRAHFLAIAARVMRQVLVDAGRKRGADKRRKITVTLTDGVDGANGPNGAPYDAQALETALIRLSAIDAQRAEIVAMRYYGGMTSEEIGLVLGMSEATVRRSWRATRAWLKEALDGEGF
ncbi:MAG: sigma-70 family RNA polymerase sigma factor [Alphaproteobacteria bacterium]|nr:sigma-70 family RNA polymerase sigma factor [Alphaproteobacteria bacterium]